MTSFYSQEEVYKLGFKKIGFNVQISRKASFYNIQEISIGNNVRIDDFCVLSGKISLGNFVHISTFTSIIAGTEGVIMEDYSGLSSRVSIYACSDDYSGNYLTNPTVHENFTNIISKKVVLRKHSIVGVGSVILPGVELGEGVSIGAMSLVTKSLESWGIYAGIPVKKLKERSKGLLQLEEEHQKCIQKNIKFKVGDEFILEHIVSEEDIRKFSEVSGDYNKIHLDEEYAKNTLFKGRIAHGFLSASFISNVIGNYLPGNGSIYKSQSLNFIAPVRIGDTVKTVVTIERIKYEKSELYLNTRCLVKDKVVISGEAIIKYIGGTNNV